MRGFVLRKAEVDAAIGAEALAKARRAAAESEAARILATARAEAEAAAAALLAEAKARAEVIEREASDRAAGLISTTEARISRALAAQREMIVELVLRAVARILGTFDARDLVAQICGQTLAEMRAARRVVLRVPSQAAERVAAVLAALPADGPVVTLIPDPDLAENDCIVESDLGLVRAGLNAQLEQLQAALLSPPSAAA